MEGVKNEIGLKGQKGRYCSYESSFRREVARQYLAGTESKHQVAVRTGVTRYNVRDWVKRFSSELASDVNISVVTEQEKHDFDALKKQNDALSKMLDMANMKNFALETLIDLAKTELGVDVRKNSGAKQPGE